MGAKKLRNFSDNQVFSSEDTQVISSRKNIIMDAPPVLCMVSGPHKMVGQVWLLQEDCVIGRDRKQSDILIQETGVSRKHVLIKCRKEKVQVQDLGSTNGTFLNNKKMDTHRMYDLEHNDLIKIGHIVFKFAGKGHVEGRHFLHVQSQIYQDELCQIKNRVFMELEAKNHFVKARENDSDFSFVIFDIDFFKQVNDGYSHLAGDFILLSVSQLVGEMIRNEDIFCRIGGEEFGLMIPTSLEDTVSRMEKIRKRVQSEIFNFGNQKIQITLSAGVSSLRDVDKSWKDLYSRADKFLYQAKRSGRNQVCYG